MLQFTSSSSGGGKEACATAPSSSSGPQSDADSEMAEGFVRLKLLRADLAEDVIAEDKAQETTVALNVKERVEQNGA